jgi:hypothetical protein
MELSTYKPDADPDVAERGSGQSEKLEVNALDAPPGRRPANQLEVSIARVPSTRSGVD